MPAKHFRQARLVAGFECRDHFLMLGDGFGHILSFNHILLMMIGATLGILVGVLPGLGAPNGVSLLLPLTFSMDPISAIILLSCIYWGALFGGSTTSILFNIPGGTSSVATAFDGYPMAKTDQTSQPLTRAFASFISMILSFALASVGINADLGNLIRLHRPVEHWQEMMGKVAPYAKYWHVKNYTRTEDPASGVIVTHPAPLESGIINYRSAIRMALAHGFSSPFLCEHYGGDGLSVSAANREYLRRILPRDQGQTS